MPRAPDLTKRREELEKRPDVDLERMWRATEDDFLKRTGCKLDRGIIHNKIMEKADKVLRPDILGDETDDPESERYAEKAFFKDALRRARGVFSKVLEVIWGFSEFFIPIAIEIPIVGVGVSFLAQAINLLIATTQEYREIFVKAAHLFEQVGFFSLRFEMLMEAESEGAKLHPKYSQFLNRIMSHTVRCAALFIEITNKAVKAPNESKTDWLKRHGKFAAHVTTQFFSTMAGNDLGVADHMQKLQDLVKEEGQLSTALILASVLKIHKDVVAVRGSINTMSDTLNNVHDMMSEYTTSLDPSRVERLRALLGISQEPWDDTFYDYATSCVAGTGTWLLEHEQFRAWVTARVSNAPQMLAIEAESNFGKSYLATIAIMHLRAQALEANSQCPIAFYYFNKASKDLSPSAIIRAIAYQLCTQNTQFLNHAYSLLKVAPSTSQVSKTNLVGMDLWSSLIVEVALKLEDFACVVVFSGLELLTEEQLTALSHELASSQKANQNLRILLTGNAHSLDIFSRGPSQSISTIALDSTHPNRDDIILVTKAQLARCKFFSDGVDGPELAASLTNVCNRLFNKAGGDFYLLESRISEIQPLLSMGEIERVLERADDNREATIKRHLSNVAARVSGNERKHLKDTLHLLAVLDILDAPMPHVSILAQYLYSGEASTSARTKVQSNYPGLVSKDTQGSLGLATDEIKTYLLPNLAGEENASTANTIRDKQLGATQHILTTTFNPVVLKEHGLDDEFFEYRSRLSRISDFIVDCDRAMAEVAIRFFNCLFETSSTTSRQSSRQKEPLHSISALAREVLPRLLLRIDTSKLDEKMRADFGTKMARMFLDSTLLDLLWPVDVLSQVATTWSNNAQYYAAVYDVVKQPSVLRSLQNQHNSQLVVAELQGLTQASDLKATFSKMIARRWLLSKSFWNQDDVRVFFMWFITMLDLGFVEENFIDSRYDEFRTIGWFTPPNWERIESWVIANIQVDDRADFNIQKGVILIAFGNRRGIPIELLKPLSKTDWRAAVWLGEAISYSGDYLAAFDAVEQCLDILIEQGIDQATAMAVNDSFLAWIGHWENPERQMQIKEKLVQFDRLRPGVLSTHAWAGILTTAVNVNDRNAGLNTFRSHLRFSEQTVLNTLVCESSSYSLHIALGRTLAHDPKGSHLNFLEGTYQEALALCEDIEALSPKDRHSARVKLTFWLGRLYFISRDQSRLSKAITCWEGLVTDFVLNPSSKELDVLVPIITHLCAAYIQAIRQESTSLKADHIMAQVTKLHDVTGFSQKPIPIALKMRFRVSLCLARIYVVRGEVGKAREVLQEHAVAAFAMLSQRNNKPLFSIGWLYLASILTVLEQNDKRAMWAWSKVRTYQPTRWNIKDYYALASDCGPNPQLDAALRQKIDAIKTGEEYMFWDGIYSQHVSPMWVDDFYLPWYTTMVCDGRNCRAYSPSAYNQPPNLNCEALQVAADIKFRGSFPHAQGCGGFRIAFRVCRECMLCKMCVTCYTRLEADSLPPTGCRWDHSALIVPGSKDDDGIPYEVYDEDMNIIKEESKEWNVESILGNKIFDFEENNAS